MIARLGALIEGMDKDGDLERRIAKRVKAVTYLSSTCFKTGGQDGRCPESDPTAKLRIELDNVIMPFLGHTGGLLKGNRHQIVKAFFLT